jgi:hydrogenase-4 component F
VQLALLVAVPAFLGILALRWRAVSFQIGALLGGAVLHLALTVASWVRRPMGVGDYLVLDDVGTLFLSITSVLFAAAAVYSVGYLTAPTHDEPAKLHRFVPYLLLFLSAMTLVTVTHHFAVLWAAIEATTLSSAPLVYFYRRGPALEAAWKYLMICSVGIALALLGTFFLGTAEAAAGNGAPSLTLTGLSAAAPAMPRPWLRAAFVLALVGYGTKMGLAPMHTWLPDTHSQAPSPVSALLSGALLNCAFLGVLRFFQVCLASGDAAFARTLLLLLGFVSIAVATAFLLGQRDYKRLFAYSSVENMGILAVGVGLGGAATYGAMLHAVNHSFAKAGLFFLAGNVLRSYGTTKAGEVRGVARQLPLSGPLLFALFLAISGMPPFGPFMSEFTIFQAAIGGPHAWLGVVFIVLLVVAALALAGVLLPMLQGRRAGCDSAPVAPERALAVASPLVLAAAVLLLGVYVPQALAGLLGRVALLVGGGP